MSKCPLRLYFNENFTFSPSSSFHNHSHASVTKCRSCLTELVDGKVLGDFELCEDHPYDVTPILEKYILDHTKSIEAYRAIHAQQQDILRLCRKKLNKRYSESFTSTITDEDIIRALNIIQDNELEQDGTHPIDQVVVEILNGILTDVPRRQDVENKFVDCRSILARKHSASNQKSPKRYRVVFKKVKALFKRSKSFTSSITLTSKAITKYSDKQAVVCTRKGFIGTIDKKFEDFKQPGKITYITNPTIYTTTTTYQPFLGMGPKTCSCHKDLLKLQDEFVRQQSEIKMINTHLQQCLSMLQDINIKPTGKPVELKKRKKKNLYTMDAQVYYNAISSARGPYSKGDRLHRSTSSLTHYPRRRHRSSSTETLRRKKKKRGCCPCKKKKKKNKRTSVSGSCSDSCEFWEMVPDSTASSSTTTTTTSRRRRESSSKIRKKKKKSKKKSSCCGKKKKKPDYALSSVSTTCECKSEELSHHQRRHHRSSSVTFHHKTKHPAEHPQHHTEHPQHNVEHHHAGHPQHHKRSKTHVPEHIYPLEDQPKKSSSEVVIRTVCYPESCKSRHTSMSTSSQYSTSMYTTTPEAPPSSPCPLPGGAGEAHYSKFGGSKKKNKKKKQCDVCGPDRSTSCACKQCVKGRKKKRGKKGKRDISSSDLSGDDKARKRRKRNCMIRLCKVLCCCPC